MALPSLEAGAVGAGRVAIRGECLTGDDSIAYMIVRSLEYPEV